MISLSTLAETATGGVPLTPILGAIVVAAITAFGAFFVATRRLSGKINTSEASELWKESKALRDEYRERVGLGEKRTLNLEGRVAELERENTTLIRSNDGFTSKNVLLEQTITQLRATVESLESEIVSLKKTVSLLQNLLKKAETE